MHRPSPSDASGPQLASCDRLVERMTAVLVQVLGTGARTVSGSTRTGGSNGSRCSQSTAHRLAHRGAKAVLPAVLAMQRVQEWVQRALSDDGVAGGWDGLLHRRCLLRPHPNPTGLPGRPSAPERRPATRAVGGLVAETTSRAGWELIRATVPLEVRGQGWEVVHELARRSPVVSGRTAGPRNLTGPDSGFDPPVGAALYRLGADDVTAWAEATGDRNAIHRVPGRAAAAGLPTGPGDVAAHGLLLAALSLAVREPSPRHQIRLRFIGSVDVPALRRGGAECWASLAVDCGSGDVAQGRRTVLQRR